MDEYGTKFVKRSTKSSREPNGTTSLNKFVEMKKEVLVRNPSGSSRAWTLWKML